MDISQEILSEFVVFTKYAKYIPQLQRRETWSEICDRYESMMLQKYPNIVADISDTMKFVRNKKVLPSMRAMQFAGPAITKNESRIYNCAFLPVDHYKAFSETMFLLLGGTGVGYSVQYRHVDKLPNLVKPTGTKKYIIGDSIEGWADAVKTLMKAYFGYRKTRPVFDFSDIREKGARLVTAGGKAPGPEPLRICLEKIEHILTRALSEGQNKLTPIDCHDIQCHIANAVLAGGIRRAAMISLFSYNDEDMLTCKSGNWWEHYEQRGRANNSVILDRNNTTKEQFDSIWTKVKDSGAGEPGIYWTNNLDWGTNPCCEIALPPFQFCNLTECNVSDVDTQEELNIRVKAASFLGTLQAGFTNFHYLRDIWRKTTEEDALVGIGMTGIGSGKVLNLNLKEAANVAKETNKDYSHSIGINSAARVTTIKPSGTTSCVLGTSSGIHAWHNSFYIRRIRLGKNEAVYTYLSIYHPELIEDDHFRPDTQAVLSIPQRAPKGSILRTETALDLLERTKKFNLEWVKEGHVRGDNTNNVSATISIDSERIYGNLGERFSHKNEWEVVGEWMWENKDSYNGLSVLPADNGTYVQAPFEDITEDKYNELAKNLSNIDLTKVIELDDNTDLSGEAACSADGCIVK
jgi:ribonucleoside-triphosphate reductase (thioredoxin)